MNLPNQFMQMVNGTLAVVFLVLGAILVRYLFKKWKVFGWRIKNYEETAMAIGMLMTTVGMVLFRAPIWVMRHAEHTNLYTTDLLRPWVIGLIGAGTLLSITGGLCLIRILACPAVEDYVWIGTLIVAVAFGVGFAL